jgi:formate dehydrogenase iron-sulfur subunit
MELRRREFLKASAGAAGLILLGSQGLGTVARAASSGQDLAMLVDVSKCIGCWWCYAACKKYNNLPETIKPDLETLPELSPECWTTLFPLKRGDDLSLRKQACMHCTDAACVEVCPTGALSYNELGFVQYDREKCSGCGYCAQNCPFEIPKLESSRVTGAGVMDKCTFCIDRVSDGESTACAEACPTGAITFGERSELLDTAGKRVTELEKQNPSANLYGATELGGLHVMYVLDEAPDTYGLPVDPQVPTATEVRGILKWLGIGVTVAAVAGFGLNYLIARMRIARGGERG